jgi:hypothetical protein
VTAGPGSAGRPLPYSDPAHQAAHQFLVEEAALLDAADYAGWLGLLCDDIRYLMPVRVTTARGAGFDTLADMGHFDEDRYALRKRVQRLATDHAWTEDPPSRTRHFVTNVRTFPNQRKRTLSSGVEAAGGRGVVPELNWGFVSGLACFGVGGFVRACRGPAPGSVAARVSRGARVRPVPT